MSDTALLPTLYRCGFAAHENPLLQMFRARAAGFHDSVPRRDDTDQWLFLARHAGLPTRLLDWSEGALLALHFALREERPAVVWRLNPLQLNHAADQSPAKPANAADVREFPLPWHDVKNNPAFKNIRGAWEMDSVGVELPVAVYPAYVHPRLRGQRACFTVQGKDKRGLNKLVPDSILKCYQIDSASRQTMKKELLLLGITDSVIFPDLDGLASELREWFN